MDIAYTANATATGGGREGKSRTDDGKVDVTLTPPKEMGGSGAGTNPEQLFATGYAACFLGALRFAAKNEKKTLSDDATITTHVGIGKRDDGQGFGLAVTIEGHLPGLSKQEAEALMEKAHVVCPYSHSIRGNVVVTTKAV